MNFNKNLKNILGNLFSNKNPRILEVEKDNQSVTQTITETPPIELSNTYYDPKSQTLLERLNIDSKDIRVPLVHAYEHSAITQKYALENYLQINSYDAEIVNYEKDIELCEQNIKLLDKQISTYDCDISELKKITHSLEVPLRDRLINVAQNKKNLNMGLRKDNYDSIKLNNNRITHLRKQKEIAEIYPEIDLEFLKQTKEWRFQQEIEREQDPPAKMIFSGELPVFAAYTSTNPNCDIRFLDKNIHGRDKDEYMRRDSTTTFFSKIMPKTLADRFEMKINMGNPRNHIYEIRDVKITSTFQGFIRDNIKEAIKKAEQTYFKNNTYIIAEAEYTLKATITPVPLGCPLIAGVFPGEYGLPDKAYFVGAFNTSPPEEFVMNNYVSNRGGRN